MHSASGYGPVFRWGAGLRRVGLTQAYRAGQPLQSHWANFAQPDHGSPTVPTSHSMTHLAIHGKTNTSPEGPETPHVSGPLRVHVPSSTRKRQKQSDGQSQKSASDAAGPHDHWSVV